MSATNTLAPSAAFRRKLRDRGGASVARCYQCATCSASCELATADRPFPRQQMHEAQWGLAARAVSDPALWLCHQCNDCSERCPRDARPGDVMQVLRGLAVEALAAPGFMGRLVANVGRTWPLLLGAPILFWLVLLSLVTGLAVPPGALEYGRFVPHGLIYAVNMTAAVWVLAALSVSGWRCWSAFRRGATPRGSGWRALGATLWDIATHRRFGQCGEARTRRWGHWALMWGFVGAAAASGLIIVVMYGFGQTLPLPQLHPVKVLGNVAAVLLVIGGLWLVVSRLARPPRVGATRAADAYLLGLVLLIVATGVGSELLRLMAPPAIACAVYLVHLGAVLALFVTAPYSKLAHLVYRTLAMTHERMAAAAAPVPTLDAGAPAASVRLAEGRTTEP
jgi:quinone-modifying oxidoreductase, subunit QmoC